MGKRWVLGVGMLMLACAQKPAPQTAPTPTHAVEDPSEPKYMQLPKSVRDWDILCVDWNLPGTCATVGEVKTFLTSKKAE